VGLQPPFRDEFSGTGLMEMFLWAVGSFHVFGEQLDVVGNTLPTKILMADFPLFKLMYRCKVPSCAMWQKAFIFPSTAFILSRKVFIFLRKAFVFPRSARQCK